jgi:hypothetical protein
MMKTKKLKLTYLLWVLLIPAITFAQQSISGTITDQDTGELPGWLGKYKS